MLKSEILIDEVNVVELNKVLQNNILVTTKTFKKQLLEQAFHKKEIITFKLFNEHDFKNYINLSFPSNIEYIVFKKLKNYNLTKQVVKNLDAYLPYYLEHKEEVLSNITILDDKNSILIFNIIKYLENLEYIKKINKNINKKVYSLNVDLDYMLFEYTKVDLKSNSPNEKINIFEYTSMEDEIFDTFNAICKLIDQGVGINKIKIYTNNKYYNIAKVISKYYNLQLKQDVSCKLSQKEVMKVIKSLELSNIKEQKISQETYDFLNTHSLYLEDSEFISYAEYKLKEINKKNIAIKNSIDILNIEEFTFSKDEYNFILGVNNFDFLKYDKEDDFLLQSTKEKLKLKTASFKNKQREKLINKIFDFSDSKKTIFSYSKKVGKNKVEIYDFINHNCVNKINGSILEHNVRYSKSADIYNLKKYIIKSKKENKKYNEVKVLTSNIKEDKNKYFQMKKKLIWDVLEYKTTKNISATSLDKFYKCNFLFYVENILGIKRMNINNKSISIGNYIHYILENIINPNNFDKFIDKEEKRKEQLYKNIIELSIKYKDENENFDIHPIYVYKMNLYLIDLCINIVDQIAKENFKIFSSEEQINMDIAGYNLVGKIDSLLKYDNYILIVDYKTGSSTLDLNQDILELGINLQNIIYYILIKQKYESYLLGGTYRYKVKPKLVKSIKDNISLREGYTVNYPEVFSNIEPSNYKNLKKTKDGYAKMSKILANSNQDEYTSVDEVVDITYKKILNFISFIEQNNIYKARPLKTKTVDACSYCLYKDICYKSKADYQYK